MKVSEIMKTNLVTISPYEPIGKAIKIMEQYRFRRLPVVRDGHLIGIITDRDIRKALNSPLVFHEASYDNYLHNEIKIESCMSACPISISPYADVVGAARIMEEEKIGGLPVVEAGRLVGIITVSDLVELLIRILTEKSA